MATYVIGDVQGCRVTLERLLDRIRFDPADDRLWFCGDLVNRGPDSLGVLRIVHGLADKAITVLGNHDIHLLEYAAGQRRSKERDTLSGVLAADDGQQLVRWLRHRPLAHRQGDVLLVHAGLLPGWSADDAMRLAGEVEAALRVDDWTQRLEGVGADRWNDSLSGSRRLLTILAAMTRLRVCTSAGVLSRSFKGAPHEAPPELLPWFNVPDRRSTDVTILFGHWAALGLYRGSNVIGLDSGCVWGGSLTALRLEDHVTFQEPSEVEATWNMT